MDGLGGRLADSALDTAFTIGRLTPCTTTTSPRVTTCLRSTRRVFLALIIGWGSAS